jgi:hypothetical protein
MAATGKNVCRLDKADKKAGTGGGMQWCSKAGGERRPPAKLGWRRQAKMHNLVLPCCCTVNKRFAVFPSPAGMSLTKLSLAGKNLIHNLFYSV